MPALAGSSDDARRTGRQGPLPAEGREATGARFGHDCLVAGIVIVDDPAA